MDLHFTPAQERFRADARAWLGDRLDGSFAKVRGRGGPGDEHELFDERWEWEQELGRDNWIGLGWPAAYGGRGASLVEQVIFYEEYARACGPGRVGIVGEGLLGPTVVHFGEDSQKRRFLPGILRGTEIWCQGYSEPDAGSDLANVQTRAELDGDEWVLHGQKVWTSLAHWAHWIFVLARTEIDRRARLVKEYSEVPPVHASESGLGQVLLNLVLNVAESIPEGQAHRNEIRIRTQSRGSDRVAIEVADTGAGIADEPRGTLFDPAPDRAASAAPMRLSVCQAIVTLFGGEMEVENEARRGSVFRVLLRAARP